MTQQYIAGESSLRLGELHAVTTDQERVREVGRLRYEAETVPPAKLGSVVVRALGVVDGLCWDSLGCGDAVPFGRQAAICADLWKFDICPSSSRKTSSSIKLAAVALSAPLRGQPAAEVDGPAAVVACVLTRLAENRVSAGPSP